MGLAGRKESEKEGVEAGTARWVEGGERCVTWQWTERWKMRGVVFARCVGAVEESIMGCRLMVMVVLFATELPFSNDNLRFSKCSLEPQRALRNGRHLAGN